MKEQPNSNTETQKKNPTKTSKNDTYFFIYINLEFHLKAIFFIEKKSMNVNPVLYCKVLIRR